MIINLIKLLTGCFLVIHFMSGCNNQSKPLKKWEKDLTYLQTELPKRHVNLFVLKSKEFFNSEINEIKIESESLESDQLAIRLQQFLSKFGDSHTGVDLWGAFDVENLLPLQSYWFQNGLFILRTNKSNEEILGTKLISINGHSIKTLSDSLKTLLPIKANQSLYKAKIPGYIQSVEILKYFGFVSDLDSIVVGYSKRNGNSEILFHTIIVDDDQAQVEYRPDSLPIVWKSKDKYFADHYFKDQNIYYISYNKCWSRELELASNKSIRNDSLPSFKAFKSKVLGNLRNYSIDKLIFDLRLNKGGASKQGTEFIKELSEIKDPPKIFVIVGRKTYSSAIINVYDFVKWTDAIFVGEDTGGAPNHYGNIRNMTLPETKIRIIYSTQYYQLTDNETNTFQPDFYQMDTFEDYSEGIDKSFEFILSH